MLSDVSYVLVMRHPLDPTKARVFNKTQLLQATVKQWASEDLVETKNTERKIEAYGPVAT